LQELLQSLALQTDPDFDVIVVDDGSTERSDKVVGSFSEDLSIQYFYKENSGPGNSRNYGCEKSESDFFVFFDSDCLIPAHYVSHLKSQLGNLQVYGGPDREHPSFTSIQKAISYSMTSLFTTGGIRGNARSVEKFHPRSFNMGFSREVYEKTGGFSRMRFGEDIDLSIRIIQAGFKVKLLSECFVYHKRRATFRQFFKQVFNSGIARINLYKRHPSSLKLLHFFPSAFVVYQVLSIPHAIYHSQYWVLYPTILYLLLIFFDSARSSRNIPVALLSVWASIIQLTGYGSGFIKGFIKRIILKQPEFHDYEKTFYD
jgi:glycosyltransferase involved in cell wall biosynthesis